MGPARERVANIWDLAVAGFLAGDVLPAELRCWFRAYEGSGLGEVDPLAIPEPYIGSLEREPAMIFLALNPGRPYPAFQHADGVFAHQIRSLGSYRAWASTWPYLHDPEWLKAIGPVPFALARQRFMQRWHQDNSLGAKDMLLFELYPWHSRRVTGRMAPDPEIIKEFVWAPIAEFSSPVVFAFGAPWFAILQEQLGLTPVACLGKGGRPYGTRVESRSVLVMESDSGALVVAEKHSGSAAPPSDLETELLRHAIEEVARPSRRDIGAAGTFI